ncbi:MAG: hypothetical protein ACFB10_20975 [Salibacteraceae bacterium]
MIVAACIYSFKVQSRFSLILTPQGLQYIGFTGGRLAPPNQESFGGSALPIYKGRDPLEKRG